MRFQETELAGCFVIEPEVIVDGRGHFARYFSREEFETRGLNPNVSQGSISRNTYERTLRGLHYQTGEFAEAKLIRCTRGKVFDVAVDIRRTSPTFGRWTAAELSEDNGLLLYIPEGMAHGFMTLCPDVEMSYQISAPYNAEAARGIRWDDPQLGIAWPATSDLTMSDADRTWPFLAESELPA